MSRSATQDVPPEILDEREDERREARESRPEADDIAEAGSGMEMDLAAHPERLDAGTAVIRRFWATLPNAPGVYRMLDHKADLLYVGKARSLKARVGSYVRGIGHSNRIARMIAETASMEFITTATETEALLLEANLIKQLKPRYNVLLRDDKSLPYILLTADSEAPQVVKHRGARNRKGNYYGPFASVWAVNRTINALQRAFLLRSCSDSYYENRTRPCLLFQIKRCAGPCTGEVPLDEYAKLSDQARAFLSGRSSAVKDTLAAEMNLASEELEFERAARYRDRLAALSAVQSTQGINTQNVEEADVFAIDEQAGSFCVEVFFFRNHQNWGNRAYFPRADRSHSKAEVLAAFIVQFYDDKPAPRCILVSEPIDDEALIAEALSVRAERKIELCVPKRGERRVLTEAALRNAREALGRRLAETSSQQKLLVSLAAAFGLARPPRRIEVYDNSHIMGTNAVGAMVVAGPSGFMKTHYRTFNMKSEDLAPGDDFGMMREMLRRRFARLAKDAPRAVAVVGGGLDPTPDLRSDPPAAELSSSDNFESGPDALSSPLWGGVGGGGGPGSSVSVPSARPPLSGLRPDGPPPRANPGIGPPSPQGGRQRGSGCESRSAAGEGEASPDPVDDSDAFPAWPDLVLIDGGKGQLDAARAALAEIGITGVPLVGVAKGRDRDAGRETFFVEGQPPIRLPPRDPALYFVQRLRDEAHRFAIGTHRARRKSTMSQSGLDEIAGIGPSRKRALLQHFGTLKAVSRAALEDLMRAPGVNAATARAVYDYFQDGGRT